MSNAVFPSLPGLRWDVTKSPRWLTKLQQSVSGKELRAAFWTTPLYTWQLSYELLRASAELELQTLVGFFNARQGRFDSFLFDDPSDHNVTQHGFGIGDGVDNTFQLQRTLAGPRQVNSWDPNLYPVYTVSRANSALWSRDLTNAAYAGSATPAFNAVGLDGTPNTATTLTDSSAVAIQSRTQTVAVPNDGATHTVAIWIRKDSTVSRFPLCFANITGGTAVGRGAYLNTQTGAFVAGFVTGSGTTRVVDGGLWWIVEFTLTNNSSGNTVLMAQIDPARSTTIGVDSVAATGSVIVGQLQIEKNATAYSPPIFTTSAAVRVDPAYWPLAGDGFEPVFDLDYSIAAPQIFSAGVLKTAGVDYNINSSGLVSFVGAPIAGSILTWSGYYYWRVRFDLDQAEFNNFMYQLWEAKKVTLVSVKT